MGSLHGSPTTRFGLQNLVKAEVANVDGFLSVVDLGKRGDFPDQMPLGDGTECHDVDDEGVDVCLRTLSPLAGSSSRKACDAPERSSTNTSNAT